jgi:hypothetical protein
MAVRLSLEYCASGVWTGNRSTLLVRIVGEDGSGTVCGYCNLKAAWSACPVRVRNGYNPGSSEVRIGKSAGPSARKIL